jgi:hypothetical protein
MKVSISDQLWMSIPLYYVVNSSDTVDLRNDVEDGEGEYTEALRREYTPPEVMDQDIQSNKPKQAKKLPKQPQKYVPSCLQSNSRLSRHGIPIPSLPRDLIRNLAQQFSTKTLSKDALPQIERATDEFFRNIRFLHFKHLLI